jgi:hypothetical protein
MPREKQLQRNFNIDQNGQQKTVCLKTLLNSIPRYASLNIKSSDDFVYFCVQEFYKQMLRHHNQIENAYDWLYGLKFFIQDSGKNRQNHLMILC